MVRKSQFRKKTRRAAAAALLMPDPEPFRQARPVWDRLAEMILIAATTKK